MDSGNPSAPLRAGATLAPLGVLPPATRFEDCRGVLVQQETNLCCRFCCCQPNVHYRMQVDGPWETGTDIEATWYISEDAPFLGRCGACMFPGCKETRWTVHAGESERGPVLMTHEKGEVLGTSRYVCDTWCFVPKFDVFNAEEQHVVRVRPDTCCLGCCVRCRGCGGAGQGQGQQGGRGGKFRVPFLVREPGGTNEPIQGAAVTNLWPGACRACCTKMETLRVTFPEDAQGPDEIALKHTLIGTTLLLNTLLFDFE